MIIHFDPSSTEQFQTTVTEAVHLTLGTHSTASGMQYLHCLNVNMVLFLCNPLFENRDATIEVVISTLNPFPALKSLSSFFLLRALTYISHFTYTVLENWT